MTPLDAQSDSELMCMAQAGRRDGFGELVHRYQGRLLRVADSRLGRRDWAEEAVQEALLAAFRSRMSFQLDKNFRTWLWTILLNQCHRHYQRRARRPDVVSLSPSAGDGPPRQSDIEPECPLPSPVEALLAKERAAEIDALLLRLTEPQADALRLRFFAGLKFHEIAETMGCTPLTAKNRVRYGLARMAQFIVAQTSDENTGGPPEIGRRPAPPASAPLRLDVQRGRST